VRPLAYQKVGSWSLVPDDLTLTPPPHTSSSPTNFGTQHQYDVRDTVSQPKVPRTPLPNIPKKKDGLRLQPWQSSHMPQATLGIGIGIGMACTSSLPLIRSDLRHLRKSRDWPCYSWRRQSRCRRRALSTTSRNWCYATAET
jgi:hypothetical protein